MKLNNLIKEIIENNLISSQSQIIDILLNKYNIDITQSNISRILKQIKAVKVTDQENKSIYEIQQKLNEVSNWIKKLTKKIEDNGYNIVITSYPGSSNIIAQAIDEKEFENVLGTIAGDNTLLVIPKNITKIKELKQELTKFLF